MRQFSIEIKNLHETSSHNRKFKDSLGTLWMIEVSVNDPVLNVQFKNMDGQEQPFKCFVVVKHLNNSIHDIAVKFEDMMVNGIGMVEEITKIANIEKDYMDERHTLKIEYAITPINMHRCMKSHYEKTIKKLTQELQNLKRDQKRNVNIGTFNNLPHTINLILKKDQTRQICN